MQGFLDAVTGIANESGFMGIAQNPGYLVMIVIACVLLYLAIVRQFEPLLLLPIAFGMLLANLPFGEIIHMEYFIAPAGADPSLYPMFSEILHNGGLADMLYLGVKLGIYPPLIFLGIGTMTDFGPLISNPKSLLLGAAAQLGIFTTYLGARFLGFTPQQAASIGIIGGADGPTAIMVSQVLNSDYKGAITVAAYSYMALVPIIQPMAIKLVTTKKERQIRMPYNPKSVSRTTKILFPIIVTLIAGLIAPDSIALVGFLMFGNLIRECGRLENLSLTAQGPLANLITIFLGITIAFQMKADQFLTWGTLLVMALGLFAFVFDTMGGVLFAKLLNIFLPKGRKINPMVGGAGISAFPMSARVIQKMALKEDNQNHLLMHAVGANVAGQIGSVVAGGIILSLARTFGLL